MSQTPEDLQFNQNDMEVQISLAISESLCPRDIKCKVQRDYLTLVIAGRKFFDGELAKEVEHEEAAWSLETCGSERKFILTMPKTIPKKKWAGLSKEEQTYADSHFPAPEEEGFDYNQYQPDLDMGEVEVVEDQLEGERVLEARFNELRQTKGIDDDETLKCFFAFYDQAIQLYRLDNLDAYLDIMVPVCRKKSHIDWRIKGIQGLACVRWKQSRFQEALDLQLELESMCGKNHALCENIAHTYSSLGDLDNAERYFREGLTILESQHGRNGGNRGGTLLGLGLVRDRLGKTEEALPVIQQSYDFYKERSKGNPSSLQAKAATSLMKVLEKLGRYEEAEFYIREAIPMMEVTCGKDNPLLAECWIDLGKLMWRLRRREEAREAIVLGFEVDILKDSFNVLEVLPFHNLLFETLTVDLEVIDRNKFKPHFATVDRAVAKCRQKLKQNADAACYYKSAAEFFMWGADYEKAHSLFGECITLFTQENGSEDVLCLLEACQKQQIVCKKHMDGEKVTEMMWPVTQKQRVAFNEPGSSVLDYLQEDDERTYLPHLKKKAKEASAKQLEDSGDEEVLIEDLSSSPKRISPSSKAPALVIDVEAVNYREMAVTDYSALEGLWRKCDAERLILSEDGLGRHLERNQNFCHVADASPHGIIAATICGSDGCFGYIRQLAVAPGCGVARGPLLDKATSALKDSGCVRIEVVVPKNESPEFWAQRAKGPKYAACAV